MSSNGPTKASHNMDHIKRPGVNYWDIIKAKAVQEDKRKRLSSTVSVLLLEGPRPSFNDWWIGSNPQDLDMEKFLKNDIILTENSSFFTSSFQRWKIWILLEWWIWSGINKWQTTKYEIITQGVAFFMATPLLCRKHFILKLEIIKTNPLKRSGIVSSSLGIFRLVLSCSS